MVVTTINIIDVNSTYDISLKGLLHSFHQTVFGMGDSALFISGFMITESRKIIFRCCVDYLMNYKTCEF